MIGLALDLVAWPIAAGLRRLMPQVVAMFEDLGAAVDEALDEELARR